MDSVDGNCMAMAREKTESNDEYVSSSENNNTVLPATVAFMPVQKHDLYYNMSHKNRGLAFIFNHQKFENCKERHGTKQDATLLKSTLIGLNFEVNVFTDLNKREVMDQVHRAARLDYSSYDCFLMAILTHGDDNILWASDKNYAARDIFDRFTADMCPTLAGKPKIFILQACQGTEIDPGITLVERTETDGPGSRRRYQIPVRADFLIVYASFRGYYAFRNNVDGSYFIWVLCEELKDKGTSEDILVILTFVNRRVAVDFASKSLNNDINDKKQMPYFHSSLTRLLKFTQSTI